ncbi:MAG: HigA family addiction module antidote protein [Geminicoccaceae bacterium]|nr:HigA family addiction module antidote protein [Geminicoccaceae bacterium]MCB9968441.1 HigA family addiction module antidote protein [Geminicoccaceae bacterium]HRY27476.1 HigA family addiction module antitoxin [Geminicoccaceae bacterium]
MKTPSHPGPVVRHEVLEPLGLSVTDAAEVLGVARPTLSNLLNGKAALTPEMAIRIEKAFGPKADHLLRVQLAWDLAEVRRRQDQIVVRRFEPA